MSSDDTRRTRHSPCVVGSMQCSGASMTIDGGHLGGDGVQSAVGGCLVKGLGGRRAGCNLLVSGTRE